MVNRYLEYQWVTSHVKRSASEMINGRSKSLRPCSKSKRFEGPNKKVNENVRSVNDLTKDRPDCPLLNIRWSSLYERPVYQDQSTFMTVHF